MTELRTSHRLGFRAFMIRPQYKVMAASIVLGLMWVEAYRLFAGFWVLSRLSLLLAIISFVPAGLVILIHGREFGPFLWWIKATWL